MDDNESASSNAIQNSTTTLLVLVFKDHSPFFLLFIVGSDTG